MLRNKYDLNGRHLAIRGVVVVFVVFVAAFAIVVGKLAAARVQYFPPSFSTVLTSCGRPVVDDIEVDWYTAQWRAADEKSLYLASASPTGSARLTYRFTWLRTFDPPVMVRVDVAPNGVMQLTAKQLSGQGGYDPGRLVKRTVRNLTGDEAAKLNAAILASSVFDSPETNCRGGADGSRWIFEANDHGRYRYVNRWTPDESPVRDVGRLLLSFTGWRFDRSY